MKKSAFLVIQCISLILLSGCWSRVEINDIAIVTATVIDRLSDGTNRVALQVAIPKLLGPVGAGGTSKEQKTTILISDTGKNVMDTYRRLQEKFPRHFILSHNRNLIIGEGAAKDGVSPILDFLSRGRDARLRGYILFSKREALPLLKLQPAFERYTSETIREEENWGWE